jgi:hypothetical protein
MLDEQRNLERVIRAKSKLASHTLGYKPNIYKPRTFNEKVLRRLFQPIDPIMTRTADKLLAKEFIREQLEAGNLPDDLHPIPTLWQGDANVDWSALAYPCIIKANHGSGMLHYLHKPPTEAEINEAEAKFATWMVPRTYHRQHEPHYDAIVPRLLAEPLLKENTDYKVNMFSNVVGTTMIVTDRLTARSMANYDREGNRLPFTYDFCPPVTDDKDVKPAAYNRIMEVAESVSKVLGPIAKEFVRVDCYYSEGRIYVGEITWTPGAGTSPFEPGHWDRHFGDLFKLELKPMCTPYTAPPEPSLFDRVFRKKRRGTRILPRDTAE